MGEKKKLYLRQTLQLHFHFQVFIFFVNNCLKLQNRKLNLAIFCFGLVGECTNISCISTIATVLYLSSV